MKFKYIFVVIVIALIGVAIYFVYDNNHKKTQKVDDDTYVDEEIKNLDIVENMKIGISNYDTMNPITTNNNEIININKIVFDSLVNITDDFHIERCLANDVKKIDDTHYEVVINKDVKWADGTPFLVDDIKYTIDRIKESNSIYKASTDIIESTEILNDETIRLNLNSPVKFVEYYLNFPIVSSKYYEGEDFFTSSKIPLGTGMYRISSIDEKNILLVRNDRWHGKDNIVPRTNSITIQKYGSVGEIFNTFKLNNLDIIDTSLNNYYDYIGTMGYNRREFKGRNYEYLAMNCNDELMSDVHIRKAVAYSINRDFIVQSTLGNTKMVAKTPLDYGSYLSFEDNVIEHNVEAAKQELINDGWVYDNDSWYKDGRELVLDLAVRNDDIDRINVANTIRENALEAGIHINVSQVNSDRYYQYLNEKDYQLLITGITNSLSPDLGYFYGDGNIANYNNEDVKSKINDLNNYRDIIKTANEEVPYVGLYRNKSYIIFNVNVGGKIASNCFNLFTNFNTWYRQQ